VFFCLKGIEKWQKAKERGEFRQTGWEDASQSGGKEGDIPPLFDFRDNEALGGKDMKTVFPLGGQNWGEKKRSRPFISKEEKILRIYPGLDVGSLSLGRDLWVGSSIHLKKYD